MQHVPVHGGAPVAVHDQGARARRRLNHDPQGRRRRARAHARPDGAGGVHRQRPAVGAAGRHRWRAPEEAAQPRAELVSRAVARVDYGYFRSFIDFASSGAVEEERLVLTTDPAKMVHCPDVEVYSQMGIPLYDLDFGRRGWEV
ncbi:hypothetical protein EJB05_26732, partial [Eragrostis curvula]